MRIGNLRTSAANGRTRVTATFTWEDSNRPTQDIYFETPSEFAGALTTDHDAFVLAGITPGFWHQERRLAVEGPLCPVLHEGLRVAMDLLRSWRRMTRWPLTLESDLRPVGRVAPERAGSFLSGGIDSLAVLRGNRLYCPRSHAASIKDGIMYGLEVERPDAFDIVLAHLDPIARDADVTLVPVYTNIRDLEPDWVFWQDVSHGAMCAAIAHALKRRLTLVSLGSTFDIPNLDPPIGTHPLLDPSYSSGDLAFRHDGIGLTRLAKARLVAAWPVALDHLRVCNHVDAYRRDALNCGRCEKCVRTQLALLCVGALERTRAFQVADMSEAAVRAALFSDTKAWGYPELVEPLRSIGRDDLARLVGEKIAAIEGRDWRSRLATVDRRYLRGNLRRVKQALFF